MDSPDGFGERVAKNLGPGEFYMAPPTHALLRTLTLCYVAAAPGMAQAQTADSTPGATDPQQINFKYRARWVWDSTFGPIPVFTTIVESGIQTGTNTPGEWGPHWEGFGKRIASKFGNTALKNGMEASIGAIWGEDPRYHRLGEGSGGPRVWHAIKMTFMADRASGGTAPAYARFIAVPSARLISNEWRPPSQTTGKDVADGVVLAFVRRMAGNAFQEFWPDVRRHLRHDK